MCLYKLKTLKNLPRTHFSGFRRRETYSFVYLVPFTISLLFSGHKILSFKISAKDDCFKDVSGSNLIVKKGIRKKTMVDF